MSTLLAPVDVTDEDTGIGSIRIIGEIRGEIDMNARDDEWHDETDCKLVGGPCDGNVHPMKRGWSEYVISNSHLAIVENLGNSVQELSRKVAVGEIRTEGNIEKHFDEQREKDEQDGVKLPPGGHKYRRAEDGATFNYVGPISLEEAHRWSSRNQIPAQRIYVDKAMWECEFGHAVDGDASTNEYVPCTTDLLAGFSTGRR